MKSPMREGFQRTPGVTQRVRSYLNIIYALMMHDIKNRFFGSGIGQIIMVLWPFVHIIVLIVIYDVSRRPYPFGDSLIQYSSVSIFPFIAFNYVCRWIVYTASTNKSFLNYPIIKPIDLLVARTLLEIVSITLVAMLLVVLLVATGNNAVPDKPEEAVFATVAVIFLAVGVGFLNAPFAFIIPLWNLFITLVIILAYASSGVIFVPSSLPPQILYYLKFNPVLHCVEWMRIAYFSDYPTFVLDKTYIFVFGLSCFAAGLIILRLIRRLI